MNKATNRIKSIYLDWNVFQDIIQNRKSTKLVENLTSGKSKGFPTPYSHAHIEDLLRCSNHNYTKNDLEKLGEITGKWCIGRNKDGSGFCLDRIPPICIYEAMAKDKRRPEPAEFNFKFQPYIVDKDKISNDNVLIPFLERYNGIMSAELMDSFVAHLLENGLNDYKLQRNFRNSIIEIIKINQPATEEIKQWPIYNYLLSSEEEIKSKFITIFESFLKMDGRSIELISEEEKFTTAYGVLDFFPAFKEKIEKKNNMRNMLTDALHVYIASHCSYFICGDTSSIKKAKLIYQAFNIKTRVYHVDDFINKVEI